RVQVHLLAVSRAVEQECPRPSAGQRRQRGGVERQRYLVARARDDEEVVGLLQQFADVAKAGVASRQHLPWRLADHALVVVDERLTSIRGELGGESAPAQVGA